MGSGGTLGSTGQGGTTGQGGSTASGGTTGQGGKLGAGGVAGSGGAVVDAHPTDAVPPRPPVGGNDANPLPSSTVCKADDECLVTPYSSPVYSEADCYCLGCGNKALNKATAEQHQTMYQKFCKDVQKRCPPIACPAILIPAYCQAGQCSTAARPATTVCSMTGSGCTANAVKCGGVCCKSYESCDETTKTCRCGTGPGCTGESLCGGNGAIVCGSFCCGGAAGRVCPR